MPRTSHVTTKKPARNADKVIGSNAGKHWRKITRRDQPSKSRHAGCPGCEYCKNIVRNAARAAGFDDEWTAENDDTIEITRADWDSYEENWTDIERKLDEIDAAYDERFDAYPCIWDFYMPPTERELTEDLRGLEEFDDTYVPTSIRKEAVSTTRTYIRRPQAPKDKRISRDRAAKKRAVHLARKAEAEALYAPTSVDFPRTIIKGWDTWDKAIATDKAARRHDRINAFLLAEGRADIEPEMTFEVIDDAAYDEPFEDENPCICYGTCAYSDWTVHPSVEDIHELALMGADDSNDVDLSELYGTADQVMRDDNAGSDPYTQDGAVVHINWGAGGDFRGVFGENAYDKFANPGFSIKTHV